MPGMTTSFPLYHSVSGARGTEPMTPALSRIYQILPLHSWANRQKLYWVLLQTGEDNGIPGLAAALP